MGRSKSLFQYFAAQTSIHGFKRLWIGNYWRKCWAMLILAAVLVCIYQIGKKLNVLIEDPLTIDMNLIYKEKLEFPSITLCNSLKMRVSYVVNDTDLSKLVDVIFPQEWNWSNWTKEKLVSTKLIGERMDADSFYKRAMIRKEDTILWCQLPDGQKCSSNDFSVVLTDDGYCLRFTKSVILREGGPDNALKLLLNSAQYERIPDYSPTSLKLIIHEKHTPSALSSGYDVVPGYQMNVIMRQVMTKQHANCQKENNLQFSDSYTYQACKAERKTVQAMKRCKCTPYTLGRRASLTEKQRIGGLVSCNIIQQMYCVEHFTPEFLTRLDIIFNGNSPPRPSKCIGECVSTEYEKELSYATYRDSFVFKRMIGSDFGRIRHAYGVGRESGTLINWIRKSDSNFEDLIRLNDTFNRMMASQRLIAPFGSLVDLLLEEHSCILKLHSMNRSNWEEERHRALKDYDRTLLPNLIEDVKSVEIKLESLEIEELFKLAHNLSIAYEQACFSGKDVWCGLSVIYDLLQIRRLLEQKLLEVQDIRSSHLSRLKERTAKYILQEQHIFKYGMPSADTKLLNRTNLEEVEDVANLSIVFDYYLNRVDTCLKNLHDIYSDIILNKDHTTITKKQFGSLITNLKLANFSIHHFCRNNSDDQRGSVLKLKFAGTIGSESLTSLSRSSLMKTMMNKLVERNDTLVALLKLTTFDSNLQTFLDEISSGPKCPCYPKAPNGNLMKEGFTCVKRVDQLIRAYIDQSIESRLARPEFYAKLSELGHCYEQGLMLYKATAIDSFRTMNSFLQAYIEPLTAADFTSSFGFNLNFTKALSQSSSKTWQSSASESLAELLMRMNAQESNSSDKENMIRNESQLADKLYCLMTCRSVVKDIEDRVQLDNLVAHLKIFEDVLARFKSYTDDLLTLKSFYQDNLAVVNLYYRDLAVKEIIQERAYDVLSFLCDVGGSIGLWLGASMLSLVEIFDLCFFKQMRKVNFTGCLTWLSKSTVGRLMTHLKPPEKFENYRSISAQQTAYDEASTRVGSALSASDEELSSWLLTPKNTSRISDPTTQTTSIYFDACDHFPGS